MPSSPSLCSLSLLAPPSQWKANPELTNTDGLTPKELTQPDSAAHAVLTGEYKKDELLDAARSGHEERMTELLTPLNVNCHASDGRKSTPLHLAAGYNRTKIVKLLLDNGAEVHAKDKGGLVPLHNACSYGHVEVRTVASVLWCRVSCNSLDLNKQVIRSLYLQ